MFDIRSLKITVQKGDAFVKTNGVASIWVVDKFLEFDDIPLHVRLIEQSGNHRTATIAYSALTDTKYWKPVERPAPAEKAEEQEPEKEETSSEVYNYSSIKDKFS